MSKITLMTHLDSVRGKYAKTDEVYTKVRKSDQQVIGVRLKNPTTNEPPSAAQLESQTKFAATAALVKAALADNERKNNYKAEWKKQRKYKTLTGFIFHKLYNENGNG